MSLAVHGILLWVLCALPDRSVAQLLYRQSMVATVLGGLPTMVELVVPGPLPPADVPDGPLPIRAVALDGNRSPVGEVLVWVSGGYLSAVEYAWCTDEVPVGLPLPSQLTIGR